MDDGIGHRQWVRLLASTHQQEFISQEAALE
jgi:hypothetical protein